MKSALLIATAIYLATHYQWFLLFILVTGASVLGHAPGQTRVPKKQPANTPKV